MNEAPGGADDEVLSLLKRAIEEQDPVPADAVRAAKEAWTWRTIDAELAALIYDSVVDEEQLAGVRGTTTTRALSFEAGELVVDLEVTDDGDGLRIRGQLAPAGPPVVLLDFSDGRAPVVMLTDELGRFGAERMAPGVARLRVEPGAVGGLVTDWVAI